MKLDEIDQTSLIVFKTSKEKQSPNKQSLLTSKYFTVFDVDTANLQLPGQR